MIRRITTNKSNIARPGGTRRLQHMFLPTLTNAYPAHPSLKSTRCFLVSPFRSLISFFLSRLSPSQTYQAVPSPPPHLVLLLVLLLQIPKIGTALASPRFVASSQTCENDNSKGRGTCVETGKGRLINGAQRSRWRLYAFRRRE